MNNFIKSLLITLSIFTFSCQQTPQSTVSETKPQIPPGAFPVVYRSHIYIESLADGVKGNFVFDTGADNFYFDSTFYNKHKFPYVKISEAFLPGVGARPQKTKLILDTVNVHFSDRHYKTTLVPVLGLKSILGDFADGILGQQYFSEKVLEVNYESQYLKIYDDISLVQTGGYSKIICEKVKNRIYIPLRINLNNSLEMEGKFTLDLGSGSGISLTSPIAKQFSLDDKISPKIEYYTKYGGIGGESANYDFVAKSLMIGDYQLNDFMMEYSTDKNGALSSWKNYGLLGNKILEKFNLIIDFKNSCLYIKPNDNFDKPFEKPRLGFSYTDRSETYKAWIVRGLYKGSSAENAGLQIDDKITHLNDQPVTELDYQQQKEISKQAKTIKLTVDRNGERLIFNLDLADVI